ncbi:LytTR family transcriptional regulator [Mycobacterium sp. 852002-51613_SCH5001154]|uniref:LCP family protein n=1 Tax=unclassified Mycobacterium TaxID=2642494 RepID=UPI0007FF6C2C|nr:MULTISPECIES: LCP family protein [unclassified Mycobacterium]OBF74309.1 LytTR family transcriptional regulator [Mycobacterium sp. 852002-51613_SCH5001154]OBF91683.1 LytTR family transcriptional regulator [Mycobacterium sp. 852014-52450_SCH5900713]
MNGDRPPHRPEPRTEPSPVIRRGAPRPAPAEQTTPLRRPTPPPPPPPPRTVEPSRPRQPPGPPPRPTAARTRRSRGWRRWIRAVASALVIGVLLAGIGVVCGAVWFDSRLHRDEILADYPGRPAHGRGTNWLLVGSDSRQGLSPEQQEDLATGGDIGSSRTDTILLVHLPELWSGGRVTMVSIPRDSYVPIRGHGKDKINAAFAMGGAPLLAQTLEQATGLRLDHYAEIGFGGFAGLVDALGGVTVCPTTPLSDPLAGIDLPAGCQKLNGRNALGYVRTRDTPRADLDRMVNQRQFVAALLHAAASPAVWLNPWRWYSVPHALADALTVDRDDHVWDLARLGWGLHGSPTTMTVPIGEFTSGDAGSVVVWNHDEASRLFEALAADAPVPTAPPD